MNTRYKGELAVQAVILDLMQQGFQVAVPIGDSLDYDLVVTEPEFKRLQVKYTESDGRVVTVRSRTHTVTAGRVTKTKTYTADRVDCIAVYDATTNRRFYVPVDQVEGKDQILLRLEPALNGQSKNVNWGDDYGSLV